MTGAKLIVMNAAMRTSKIGSVRELSERICIPYTTLCYKLKHIKSITVRDLTEWDRVCKFTGEDLQQLIKAVK